MMLTVWINLQIECQWSNGNIMRFLRNFLERYLEKKLSINAMSVENVIYQRSTQISFLFIIIELPWCIMKCSDVLSSCLLHGLEFKMLLDCLPLLVREPPFNFLFNP